MDTDNAPAAGEQPAATPDPITAGAQPADAPVTADSSLESLSPEQLLAALEGAEYGELESTDPTDEREEEEPEAPEETPVAEEEAPPADEPVATTTENKPLRRLPLGGIEEAQRNEFAEAANLIREGKAKDLAEAVALLRGTTPQDATAPAPTETKADTPPAEQPSASVAAIQEQIRQLREQRDEADDNFEKATVRKLTNDIEDLQVALVRAEIAERETRSQAQSWDAAHNAACDQVEAKFDAFAKADPRFYQLLEDRRTAMEARNDPALKDPAFIIAEAEKIAALLGFNKPAPPAPKTKPVTPNGQDIAPSHQSAARISRPEASRMIQEIPIEELQQLVCTE
jgi:hypothetical protein